MMSTLPRCWDPLRAIALLLAVLRVTGLSLLVRDSESSDAALVRDSSDALARDSSSLGTGHMLAISLSGHGASQGCGVILGAFGDVHGRSMNATLATARNLLKMVPGKGWCPADPDLEDVPVTLVTDAARGGGGLGRLTDKLANMDIRSPEGASFDAWPLGNDAGRMFIEKKLGTWTYQWYHTQMLQHAPYAITMYLDSDATVCAADRLRELFIKFGQSGAHVGYKLVWTGFDHHGYEMSNADPHNPRPDSVKSDDDLWSFGNLTERNNGVMLLDTREPMARKVVKDWSTYLEKDLRDGKEFRGDQFPLREAIWENRRELREFLVDGGKNGICRSALAGDAVPYSCESGCAVIHHWYYPEITAMALGYQWEPGVKMPPGPVLIFREPGH